MEYGRVYYWKGDCLVACVILAFFGVRQIFQFRQAIRNPVALAYYCICNAGPILKRLWILAYFKG